MNTREKNKAMITAVNCILGISGFIGRLTENPDPLIFNPVIHAPMYEHFKINKVMNTFIALLDEIKTDMVIEEKKGESVH